LKGQKHPMEKRRGGTQPELLNKPVFEFVHSLSAHCIVFLQSYCEKYYYLRKTKFENIIILPRKILESGLQ
jgi:hypothetical protein